MSSIWISWSSMRSDLRVIVKSGCGLKYVMVLGLGEVSFINVTGRIVDHPCSDIGPIISFPVAGF